MDTYRFGHFELRPAERRLLAGRDPVALGARAFDVLVALVERRERVVGPAELFELVWPGRVVDENNVRQHVASVRRLLGPGAIATVPGRGYRFTLPVLPSDPPTAAAAPSVQPTIAVLPFANLSGGSEQDYFADAVTQDIIARLARHRWLTVLARNTVFGLRSAVDPQAAARQLGVKYLVEGSVQRANDRLRIAAQLVDATTGVTIWSERYEGGVEEIFDVQDAITETLVGRLEPEIGFAERKRVMASPRADLHAWDRFHLALWHFFRFTAADNRQALALLQQSREADPRFGDAHAWWAYALVLDMVYWDAEPADDRLDAALGAVHAALSIDDRNAVHHMVKGRVQLARQEYGSARAANESAIELNPTLAAAHCSLGDTLAYEGRYDEAMVRFSKALALSPHDPQRWAFLSYGALALLFKGDFAESLAWAEQARELPNSQYWTLAHRAVALSCMGESTRAREAVGELLAAKPGFTLEFAASKLFYIRDPGQLQLYLEGLARADVPRQQSRAG